MTTHLMNKEWGTTYCGESPENLNVTWSWGQYTCRNCFGAHRLVEEIRSADPEQFEETRW